MKNKKELNEMEIIAVELFKAMESAHKKTKANTGYIAYLFFCTLGSLIIEHNGISVFNAYVKEVKTRRSK